MALTHKMKLVIEAVDDGKATVLDSVEFPTTFQTYTMADNFRKVIIKRGFEGVSMSQLMGEGAAKKQ